MIRRGSVCRGEGGRLGVVTSDAPSNVFDSMENCTEVWMGVGLDGRPWYVAIGSDEYGAAPTGHAPLMADGEPVTADAWLTGHDAGLAAVAQQAAALPE